MTYRRRRTKGPSLFFLLVITSVLIGGLLFLSEPGAVDRIVDAIAGGRQRTPAASTAKDSSVQSAASKKNFKPAASQPAPAQPSIARRPAEQFTQPAAATVPVTPDTGTTPAVTDEPPKADASHARVKAESLMAYASTSSRSPVVSVLKKDTMVEITLELANSEGRWSMVRIEELNQPVFVRSDSLEHAAKKK